MTEFERAVEETLRDLRPGEVVSYGFVAEQAGYPGRARAVGAFLASSAEAPNWWRVVGANGALLAPRADLQAQWLVAEGVNVVNGRCRAVNARRP